jgi:hypothetical protein
MDVQPAARDFCGSILGLQETKKPLELRARGGCWFQCDKQQVQVGVEPSFHLAKKAQPAFVMFSLDELSYDKTSYDKPFSPVASAWFTVKICRRGNVSSLTTRGGTGWSLSKCSGSSLVVLYLFRLRSNEPPSRSFNACNVFSISLHCHSK